MTAVAELDQYKGKRVIVTKNVTNEFDEKSAVEVEGTVEEANAKGLLVKPKGKTQFDLIEAGDIEQIVLAPEGDKKIKAKKLLPIVLGKARAHLLERHGYTLTDVNKLTEEEAFTHHEGLDHKAADLGHYHEAKSDDDDSDEADAED